ncbi:MAG: DNA polymerase I [Chitinophagaceae bacterium]|nr:DNA polymerase I [Chitinophagaceae bacterium]
MEKKLFLLDAYALVFRAYYALIRSPRITSKGKNTNAQFGFTNTLADLLNHQQPTHMAVCFDTAAPTERHTEFSDYKANRQETPEDIEAAVPDILKITEAFNIPILAIDGYEADDVIGTLALQAEKQGFNVYMVTPDKDYGQLVSEKIKIYKPSYQGSEPEILGPEEVCKKWNIQSVSQVTDMLALMGDAVDNIPGIPGIGEKTAAKLLAEYGSLENVLANAESIKGAIGEKIRKGAEMARLSKKLATINTQAPVTFHEEEFRIKPRNTEKLKEIFSELEFKTLGRRLLGEEFVITPASPVIKKALPQGTQVELFDQVDVTLPEKSNKENDSSSAKSVQKPVMACLENSPHRYELVKDQKHIRQLAETLSSFSEICFDTETTNIDANRAELVGLSFAVKPGEAFYIPCPPEKNETLNILSCFKTLFDDPEKVWIGHNLKYDLLVLKWYGFEPQGLLFDTMLAHYLIEPEGKRSMDDLSMNYLGYMPVPIEKLIGKKGKQQGNMRDVPEEIIKDYAAEDADITLRLKEIFSGLMKEKEVEKVFYEVEIPLVRVLTEMEYEGVKIDVDFLQEYSRELEREARQAEENVYRQAGLRFNLASPKQLGEVLFDKLQLDPSAKKTKTGQYQTGEEVLLKLAAKGHQIVHDILAYRELTKLKSTYVDALPQMINPLTGRVHTTFGQAVAVTGRLASNNPNLQNIPVRTARGKEIRKAFIPRDKNHILLSADYSQIELRIVAALSGDENMCRAFREGADIHTITASRIYKVPVHEVTKEMRYKAKSVNFGIIYGQGAFGLAENLGISRTEAREIIDNYKKEFPGIQQYMDSMIQFARKHGYVQTLLGRKRWLRDIQSSNFTVRGFAERNAINSPIQGTAADMIKVAMNRIYEEMKKRNLKSKMILQVHDELLFDALKTEVEALKPLILECMQTALPLPNGVPVIAECGEGENWLEAH